MAYALRTQERVESVVPAKSFFDAWEGDVDDEEVQAGHEGGHGDDHEDSVAVRQSCLLGAELRNETHPSRISCVMQL